MRRFLLTIIAIFLIIEILLFPQEAMNVIKFWRLKKVQTITLQNPLVLLSFWRVYVLQSATPALDWVTEISQNAVSSRLENL